ncbi:hypothetical protein BAUCODRAFT_126250 [Baudoinia panamericana UAMH 10762]|uniref:Uncharacterized protein n=1 Tax=Baudoinia panamericana (strain UAMH 10762) TaxID=717646 RepID=M2N001_BAUPA|nr:uncharacterized protein BAUCODRAFT_126250 [Baudoinia panamericana UAMH 10762]EMC92254.1 hypothetical protein BAUCODRAFT_126250 [Baudoinia panamericana UAMH 10762]
MSIRGVNALFNALKTVFELLRPELWQRRAAAMYLLLLSYWALSIPGVFTPPTLTAIQANYTTTSPMNVTVPNISDPNQVNRSANILPASASIPSANPDNFLFDGARTIYSRLASATGSSGAVLWVPPESPQSSFELNFRAPHAVCHDANGTVQGIIDAIMQSENDALAPSGLYQAFSYYAFVPSYNSSMDGTSVVAPDGTNISAITHPRAQSAPTNAVNEVWMTYWRFLEDAGGRRVVNSNGSYVPEQKYSVCALWDATYTAELSYSNGIQTVTEKRIDLASAVPYSNTDPSEPSDLVQLAYSAYFAVLADQIVGSMGLVMKRSATPATPAYSSFDSQIVHSSLLGSNDLDFVFHQNQQLKGVPADMISKPYLLKDQRLADKALAQNQTLPFLFEQLAFNFTMSLRSNPLLCTTVLANVTQTAQVNIYQYNVRNLWIVYGVADLLAIIAVCIGVFLIEMEHATENNFVAVILSLARYLPLSDMFTNCCDEHFPPVEPVVDDQVRIENRDGAGFGFHVVGRRETVMQWLARSQWVRLVSRPLPSYNPEDEASVQLDTVGSDGHDPDTPLTAGIAR